MEIKNRGRPQNKDTIEAVVQTIHHGEHGPFFVATSNVMKEEGSLTCSLRRRVWREKRHPEPGEIVLLSNLTTKPGGWRANRGRFKRPSDKAAQE